MSLNTQTRIVYRSAVSSPIGEIGESRVVEDSRWDFDGDRTIHFYSLTYVLAGRCKYHEPSGRNLIFRPGDLFFCFPGLPHRIDPMPGEQFSEFWMVFSGPVFDAWLAADVLSPERFSIHVEPIDYWLDRFENLFAHVGSNECGQMMLVGSFQTLLAEALLWHTEGHIRRPDDVWIAEAKAQINSVMRLDAFSLPTIAKTMRISSGHFHRKFSALAGMSPTRYHSEILIHHACSLMHNSWATNRRVAEVLGFGNEFYFSRRFKQITGVSPREYRDTLRKKDISLLIPSSHEG